MASNNYSNKHFNVINPIYYLLDKMGKMANAYYQSLTSALAWSKIQVIKNVKYVRKHTKGINSLTSYKI